jgi:FkbM family methyltransferase
MQLDHDYLLYRKIQENDFIVILGAYDGDFVQEYYEELKRKKAFVLHIEPDSRTYNKCLKIDKKYGVSDSLNAAVYDYTGIVEFAERENFLLSGPMEIDPIMPSDTVNFKEIQSFSLDDLLDLYPQTTCIFCDIEGAELEVFLNSKKVFNIPYVSIASYHIRNEEPTVIKLQKYFEEYPNNIKIFHDSERWDSTVLFYKKDGF